VGREYWPTKLRQYVFGKNTIQKKRRNNLRTTQAKVPERECLLRQPSVDLIFFPYGNIEALMKYTPQDIGKIVRETRKKLKVTQKDLALTSGTGPRFVPEEKW